MKITIRRKIKSHDRTIGELAAANLADFAAANLRCRVLPRVRPPAANARRKRLRGNNIYGLRSYTR